MTDAQSSPMTDEYQPRTVERLIEVLRSGSQSPRSWQQEAADALERLSSENADLRHDIDRHLNIITGQAMDTAALEARLAEAREAHAKIATDVAFAARVKVRAARGPTDRAAAVAVEEAANHIAAAIRHPVECKQLAAENFKRAESAEARLAEAVDAERRRCSGIAQSYYETITDSEMLAANVRVVGAKIAEAIARPVE